MLLTDLKVARRRAASNSSSLRSALFPPAGRPGFRFDESFLFARGPFNDGAFLAGLFFVGKPITSLVDLAGNIHYGKWRNQYCDSRRRGTVHTDQYSVANVLQRGPRNDYTFGSSRRTRTGGNGDEHSFI